MKILIVLLVLSASHFLVAQQTNSQDTTIQGENKSSFLQQDFMKKYELEGKKPMLAKILDKCEMSREPKENSEKVGIVIPKDSIVYIYKFFTEEKYWAAKYHEFWGFIPESEVFPISKRPTCIKISDCEVPPRLKSKISPIYPEEAKKAKIEGSVVIRIFINEKGVVTKTSIKEGIPELNNAAIEAVKKAKFSPAKHKGKKVGIWVPMKINFKL